MKVDEVILEGSSKYIKQFTTAYDNDKRKGGAYFHSKNAYDEWKAMHPAPAEGGKPTWQYTAWNNSPQNPDTGYSWVSTARRKKIRKATAAGVTGAQKYAQKYKDKEPFVPKVKIDYTDQMYPTN
jgi:hypothetical protein